MHDQFLTFILCGVRLTWTKSWIETTIIITVAGLILDIKLIFYSQCQTTLSQPFHVIIISFLDVLGAIFTCFFEH